MTKPNKLLSIEQIEEMNPDAITSPEGVLLAIVVGQCVDVMRENERLKKVLEKALDQFNQGYEDLSSKNTEDSIIGKRVQLFGLEGVVYKIDENGFTWIMTDSGNEYDFSKESMKKAIISTKTSGGNNE